MFLDKLKAKVADFISVGAKGKSSVPDGLSKSDVSEIQAAGRKLADRNSADDSMHVGNEVITRTQRLAPDLQTEVRIDPEKATPSFEAIIPYCDNRVHKKVIIDGIEYETNRLYKYNEINPLTNSETYFEVTETGQKIYLENRVGFEDSLERSLKYVGKKNVYSQYGEQTGEFPLDFIFERIWRGNLDKETHNKVLARLKSTLGNEKAAINAYINILCDGKPISKTQYDAMKLTLEHAIDKKHSNVFDPFVKVFDEFVRMPFMLIKEGFLEKPY